jgi:hypothetical protein
MMVKDSMAPVWLQNAMYERCSLRIFDLYEALDDGSLRIQDR